MYPLELTESVDSSYKGFPSQANPLLLQDIVNQHWNLLKKDVPFPTAVLLNSTLQNNSLLMQKFLKTSKTSFAPHGKTTMSPQLFKQQLADGAWGITVATSQQFFICWRSGVRNILMANQLIDRAAILSILNVLKEDADLNFYCLVDSLAGCELLQEAMKQIQLKKPINVLLELGFKEGRTGCRSIEEALQIAQALSESKFLQLSGIECYEGIITTQNTDKDIVHVEKLLDDVMTLAKQCDDKQFFKNTPEIFLTAGGSSYFDLVAKHFQGTKFSKPTCVIIRSGCYLTHDSKFYDGLFKHLIDRAGEDWPALQPLKPALEIWSVVQSRPEPTLAILSMGKRDVSYDIDLPIPIKWYQSSQHTSPNKISNRWKILKLNDQHAYLQIPENETLSVGDLVGCGISHPCTTFDKWKLLYIVDDSYNIINGIKTYF